MHYETNRSRAWEFSNAMRPFVRLDTDLKIAACATLLDQGWIPEGGEVDSDVLEYIEHEMPVGSEVREALPVRQFSDDELISIVISPEFNISRTDGASSTAHSIVRLAAKMLDIQASDSVANLCCGIDNFSTIVFPEYRPASIYGCEINPGAFIVAKSRAMISASHAKIECADVAGLSESFDKVFMDPPLESRPGKDFRERFTSKTSDPGYYDGAFSAPWLYVLSGMRCLNEHGKMAVLLPNAALYYGKDSAVRKRLVMGGRIESVISLPARVIPGTGIYTSLVLLSSNNDHVRFVDATDLGSKGHMMTVLTDDDIDTILLRLNESTDPAAKDASPAEIGSWKWMIDPARYIVRNFAGDGVPLGSVCVIGRGKHLPSHEIENRVTDQPTKVRYLAAGSITEDGTVDIDALPNIKGIETAEERYCLKDGDIVLGKMKPFKTALVRIQGDVKVLCSENLFILRPNAEVIDPTYLAAFLASQSAAKQLEALSVGSHIRNLPIDSLRELQIPSLSLERQASIARKFTKLNREIELYRERISRAIDEKARLFSEGDER